LLTVTKRLKGWALQGVSVNTTSARPIGGVSLMSAAVTAAAVAAQRRARRVRRGSGLASFGELE